MPRSYGGLAASDRRSARRARLLDAALDLLRGGGLRAVTVRGVCQRSRVGPRYFYESFSDIDELIVAAFDIALGDLYRSALSAMVTAAPDTRSQVRAAVSSVLDFLAADPRKGFLLIHFGLATPALAHRRRRAANRFFAVLDRYSGTSRRVPEYQIQFMVGGCAELLAAWLERPAHTDRARVVEACTELCLARSGSAPGAFAEDARNPRRQNLGASPPLG
ncbi:TetR/AcrR family transcriptional regulator [Nocardia huaxiensis]|uniref:TetR/AcrR family transcriptional regulator n=1 Tax=Nocardia huaxiensis TaxID=2755382 RepID=UPI001E58C43E|nr:TetR/AcrR family transcriptional regulator [Nocardia huaxiensis]UFS98530.1 TetR/AcrR family transcriptional regulator [Nocardia huaxiensis]